MVLVSPENAIHSLLLNVRTSGWTSRASFFERGCSYWRHKRCGRFYVQSRVQDDGNVKPWRHRQEINTHKNPLLTHAVRRSLVSICLSTVIDTSTADSFTRGCAARDLQILMVIEERESANASSVEGLSDAMLSMLEARIVCYRGRVTDAMAPYDSITQTIAPDACLSARGN